ncbi:MAG TPA: cobalt ECF transporter T component CbiQ [Acidimicrobiia bacterium]|nr:cobalt ECF transporter T component CbiQ [Acidimicrobiia bacterium]
MGAGHSHALYVHEHSPIHRLAPEAKVAATLVFVVCVAITPRQAVVAFGVYALILAMLLAVARIPPLFVAARLTAVIPFVLFALLIPFIASGPTTEFLGMELSVEGLWGTWNILVKAVLGASTTIVLTATTEISDIIRGMGDLRVPAVFTAIAMFMVRYLELIADEVRRMRTAMESRGYDPRWLAQTRPIASGAGALFVRSYERGERVHAAMLSRGFTGTIPPLGHERAGGRDWAAFSVIAAVAIAVATVALVTT